MRIGIIGSGSVARTLGAGYAAEGHEVMLGTRDPAKLADFAAGAPGVTVGSSADAAAFGEVVVLAVKGSAALAACEGAGAENLAGKTVLDTTNPIADVPATDGVLEYFTEQNSSLMELLQTAVPGANFVKAFSCVGHGKMIHPDLPGGPPTMFICGNDDGAKAQATELLEQVGWEVADYGTARAAGAIEALCILWCIPAFRGEGSARALKMLE